MDGYESCECSFQFSWSTTTENVKCWSTVAKANPLSFDLSVYHQNMGGVDQLDSLVAKNRKKIISRRWYLYLFWHTTYICLTNAWFLYKMDCKQLNIPTKDVMILRKFQGQVSASLVCVNLIMKRGRTSFDDEDDHATPLNKHKHTTYFNTPRLKTQSSTTAASQQIFPESPHSHYNRHKTNMPHIHTSIVSRHLATRGNNKILRTPPPHIISSKKMLPRHTRRTHIRFRTSKSPFLKSYLHKVDTKWHPSPLCPLCNTHIHIMSSTAPTYATLCHAWICGLTPPGSLHCWPDGRRGWLVDHKREDRTPPTIKGYGSG